jgi:hypothetical protein
MHDAQVVNAGNRPLVSRELESTGAISKVARNTTIASKSGLHGISGIRSGPSVSLIDA